MKIRKLLKMFHHKHKYRYVQLMRDECRDIYIRFCKCGKIHHRKDHMGKMEWMGGIVYTDKGAKENVEGYGEK